MEKIHHWTHELPEGKRIFLSQVNEIDLKKLRLTNISKELKTLRDEIIELEINLRKQAETQYPEEKIQEAFYKYLLQTQMDLFEKMTGIKTETHETAS